MSCSLECCFKVLGTRVQVGKQQPQGADGKTRPPSRLSGTQAGLSLPLALDAAILWPRCRTLPKICTEGTTQLSPSWSCPKEPFPPNTKAPRTLGQDSENIIVPYQDSSALPAPGLRRLQGQCPGTRQGSDLSQPFSAGLSIQLPAK